MNNVCNVFWNHRSALTIVNDKSQHLQKNWLCGHFYEHQMLSYIADKYGRSNMTIVDVGSSVGNHTLFFSKFVTSGKAISVEPVHESMDLQQRIIELNGLSSRVEFHECALSDTVRRGSMERFGPPQFNGMHKLVDGDDVHVDTLDGIVDGRDVGLIKIDVEFHEVEVVRGGLDTIDRRRPVMFIECVKSENMEVLKRLVVGELGYRIGRKFNASATYEFVPQGGLDE